MGSASEHQRAAATPGQKVAVVLCGGGLPAALYEVGALAALDDLLEPPSFVLQSHVFVGISAGATVAALLAGGDSPRSLLSHLGSAAPNAYLEVAGTLARLAARSTARSLGALARSVGTAWKYCLRSRIAPTLGNLVRVVKEVLPPGLASLDPWERKLADLLSGTGHRNSFRELSGELIIPAYDLDAGERVAFGSGGFDEIPISLAVAASSAFPGLFHPVRIGTRDFIDGGIGKVGHVDLALARGATLVIIVNPIVPLRNDRAEVCIPSLDGACSGLREKGLFYITDQVRRINLREKLELGLQCLQRDHPTTDFILIEPRREEVMLFMQGLLNDGARLGIMNYGYHSAVQAIREQYPRFETALRRAGFSPSLERVAPPGSDYGSRSSEGGRGPTTGQSSLEPGPLRSGRAAPDGGPKICPSR